MLIWCDAVGKQDVGRPRRVLKLDHVHYPGWICIREGEGEGGGRRCVTKGRCF